MYIPVLLFCLYILSLCTPTHAQFQPTSRGNCIQYCHNDHFGAYDATLRSPYATSPGAWCAYCRYECDCIQTECSTFQIKCSYHGTSPDDRSNCSVGEFECGACVLHLLMQILCLDVDADVIPPGALVPGHTTTPSTTSPTTFSTTSSTTSWPTLVPFSSTENPQASAGAAAGIILLVGPHLGPFSPRSMPSHRRAPFQAMDMATATWQRFQLLVGRLGFKRAFFFNVLRQSTQYLSFFTSSFCPSAASSYSNIHLITLASRTILHGQTSSFLLLSKTRPMG